jgi:hypothetical protein
MKCNDQMAKHFPGALSLSLSKLSTDKSKELVEIIGDCGLAAQAIASDEGRKRTANALIIQWTHKIEATVVDLRGGYQPAASFHFHRSFYRSFGCSFDQEIA